MKVVRDPSSIDVKERAYMAPPIWAAKLFWKVDCWIEMLEAERVMK